MSITTRRPRTKDILSGPVPPGSMDWVVTLTVDKPLHEGRKHNDIPCGGLRLWYRGTASWSQCHHEYTVHRTRELRKALATSPVHAIQLIARLGDVHPYCLSLCGDRTRPPKCPDGLCDRCWQQGVRRIARTYSYQLTPNPRWQTGRPSVHIGDFCEHHAERAGAVLL